MRVLLTGGAGFIGSHIVDAYIDAGHDVAVVDNLSTGKRENLNRKARFYQLDIRDKALAQVFDEFKPVYVNHHAAQIDVRKSYADPLFDAEVNILGTLNLLENAVRSGVSKIVFASSGGTVYGEADRLPASEDTPLRPIAPYGVSKVVGEFYLRYYQEMRGLDCMVLRYGNIYGPRQDPLGEAGVVAIFCRQMLRGEQPTIFGDGKQLRDYLYISDVVKANIVALNVKGSGVYNIGTGIGTSVNEIFRKLAAIAAFTAPPKFGPPRAGEIHQNYLDISRAATELGWRPSVSLEGGLKMTAEHFRC